MTFFGCPPPAARPILVSPPISPNICSLRELESLYVLIVLLSLHTLQKVIGEFFLRFCRKLGVGNEAGSLTNAPVPTFFRSRANGSLIPSSFTGFFRSKKGRFAHSNIHLAITGECFTRSPPFTRIHSLHSRKSWPLRIRGTRIGAFFSEEESVDVMQEQIFVPTSFCGSAAADLLANFPGDPQEDLRNSELSVMPSHRAQSLCMPPDKNSLSKHNFLRSLCCILEGMPLFCLQLEASCLQWSFFTYS